LRTPLSTEFHDTEIQGWTAWLSAPRVLTMVLA
jgi:hypothetical protein